MNILVNRVEMVRKVAENINCEKTGYRLHKSRISKHKHAVYLPDIDMSVDVTGNILIDRDGNIIYNRNSDKTGYEKFVSDNAGMLSKSFINSLHKHPIIKDIRTLAHEIKDLIIPDIIEINVLETGYSENFIINIIKQNNNSECIEECDDVPCTLTIPYVPLNNNDFVLNGEIDQSIYKFIYTFMDIYSSSY